MRYLKNVQYTFGFTTTDGLNFETPSENVFIALRDPEKIKRILKDTTTYDKHFNIITHQEDDFTCHLYDTIEFINDFDDIDDENAFLIGFETSTTMLEQDLKDIYNNVFIPLFSVLSDKVKPTGRILSYKEYVETEHETITV